MATTTIQVDEETADRLAARKRRGDSYDDVIRRLLDDGQDQEWRERQQEAQAAVDDLGLVENDLPGRPDELATVAVDNLDLPGSGETLEARREAIRELYAYLQREGSATRADFLELVDADRVGYASADSFWSNCVKGRDTLRVLPGVEAPSEGEHRWRFVGFDDTS